MNYVIWILQNIKDVQFFFPFFQEIYYFNIFLAIVNFQKKISYYVVLLGMILNLSEIITLGFSEDFSKYGLLYFCTPWKRDISTASFIFYSRSLLTVILSHGSRYFFNGCLHLYFQNFFLFSWLFLTVSCAAWFYQRVLPEGVCFSADVPRSSLLYTSQVQVKCHL